MPPMSHIGSGLRPASRGVGNTNMHLRDVARIIGIGSPVHTVISGQPAAIARAALLVAAALATATRSRRELVSADPLEQTNFVGLAIVEGRQDLNTVALLAFDAAGPVFSIGITSHGCEPERVALYTNRFFRAVSTPTALDRAFPLRSIGAIRQVALPKFGSAAVRAHPTCIPDLRLTAECERP